jgi:hypothetical protein
MQHAPLRISSLLSAQSTRDLGPQFVQNPHGMVGQDGAYSIPLGEETLWFFGDTLIGRRTPGESLWYPGGVATGHRDMTGRGPIERMLNNTGLLLGRQTGKDGLRNFRYVCDAQGKIRTLIPLEKGEDPDWCRIWCLHGCVIGRQVYLYYIKVRMLEEGPFPVNFEIVGSGMAEGTKKDLIFTRVDGPDGTLFWNAGHPQFGSSVLVDDVEGYVYLYGVARGADTVQRCSLARVKTPDLADGHAYEYFAGEGQNWTNDVQAASCLFTGVPNELSVSYNAYLGAYLAVHSLDLTGDIVARTAPAPWGPWSAPARLAHVDVERNPSLPYVPWVYAAKEHPELSDGGGRVIYVTYIQFEEYYPHLLEITLTKKQ